MPSHNHFDVAVVGGQLAGTLAAALLAKRHRRVAVLQHLEPQGCYAAGGVRYPLAPELVPNLDGAGMRAVHEELGVSPDLRVSFRQVESLFQSVDMNHRLDLHAAADAFASELQREHPEARDGAVAFRERLLALATPVEAGLRELGALPPVGFWATRRARRDLAALDRGLGLEALFDLVPAGHTLREVLGLPAAFFAQLAPGPRTSLHTVHVLAGYLRGAWSAHNRSAGLHGFFGQVCERLGVERVPGRIERIEVKKGRVVALHVAGRQDLITADVVLAAPAAFDVAALFSDESAQKRWRKQRAGRAPARCLYTANLLVERAVLPLGLCETAVRLADPGSPFAGPVLLAVYPCAREADGALVPERAILSVSALVEAPTADTGPLREQLIGAAETVVPFLREQLRAVTSAADAGLDPWLAHPVYAPERAGLDALLGLPLATPLKNLLACGHEVVPGLGIDGAYLCALGVARAVEASHPRRA